MALFKPKLSSILLLLASILRFNFSNSNVTTTNQVAPSIKNDKIDYYELVKLFESVPTSSSIKYKSNLANALLHRAAEIGDLKTIQYLVERHGADPGAVNKQDISPIDIAIYNKFDDAIAFFLEIKEKPSYNHCTASLHDAVRNNDIIMVRFLLESGFVDINTRDNDGQTALHLAIKNNITDMTALLISNDADIHSIDKNNYTPLHYAIMSENRAIFRLLQNKFKEKPSYTKIHL
jgi:ankyrin repeat protein